MKIAARWMAAGIGMVVGFPAWAGNSKPASIQPFENCEIAVEQNATDGDTEVVIFAKGGDDGFRWFGMRAPNGRYAVQTYNFDPSSLGQRELAFESPEPPGDVVLASYPQGIYHCQGLTTRGERFHSTARLSHQLPPRAVILSPQHESQVPIAPLLIQWSAVNGSAQILLELENESVDPEQVLTYTLPPDATSFEVPAAFLASGSSYLLSIGTVAANGNKVFVEVEFATE